METKTHILVEGVLAAPPFVVFLAPSPLSNRETSVPPHISLETLSISMLVLLNELLIAIIIVRY